LLFGRDGVRGGRGENEGIAGLLFILERETVGEVGRGTAVFVRGFFLASSDTVCGVGKLDPLATFLAECTASLPSGTISRGGEDEVIVITS